MTIVKKNQLSSSTKVFRAILFGEEKKFFYYKRWNWNAVLSPADEEGIHGSYEYGYIYMVILYYGYVML